MLLRLFALLLLLYPLSGVASDINAGFVRGIWYSSESVFADTPTRVYVAIRNNTGADLTGTVTFYANNKKIGTQPVAALNSRIIESWVDWEPAYGEYELRAELTQVKLSTVGSQREAVDTAIAAASDKIFVDYDTDGDSTGNKTDEDDDGDKVSDEEEIAAGTDPLVSSRDATTTEATTKTTEVTSSPSATAGGLERYLTPSRADTLLSGLTTWATNVKTKLDDYREARSRGTGDTPPPVPVNSDGFGEVTRTTDPDAIPDTAPTPNSFVSDFVRLIGALLSGIMTLALALVSWILGHVLFLQLLFLAAILAGTYFLAQKMGSRPMVVKKKRS